MTRHGARLDAADKQWHLTSPTPYDPPLTYGGWNQSKALGARIATILRSRETDDEANIAPNATGEESQTKRRRHRVVVHSSPFLRCVQTSIGISAGLAQNPSRSRLARNNSKSSIREASSLHSSSPKLRAVQSPRLAPVAETSSESKTDNIKKATLRIDAFLGEWLSPDYFENITPPPGSAMMVTSAKGDLLRKEDYNKLIHIRDIAPSASPAVGFPGGWGSPVVAPSLDKSTDSLEGPLSSLSSLSNALPVTRRDRTSSLSSAGSSGSRGRSVRISSSVPPDHGVYQSPVPSYAISNVDQIPPGYVAHARDHCTEIDFAWDSSREPQNWGNGGEYGEEWSSMHKRFRKGLQSLISWYKGSDDTKLDTKLSKEIAAEEDDDETDLVLILVSHGAGCNALIGALTNQPVLMDVAMASLTMAVRKPTPVPTPATSPLSTPARGHSRSTSRNIVVSDEYDVKLLANTEHLRTQSVSTGSARQNSLNTTMFKERESFSGSRTSNGITVGDQTKGMSTVFGSIRRTASVASGPATKSYTPARNNSLGLWTPPAPPGEDNPDEADEMILNFGDDTTQSPTSEIKPISISKPASPSTVSGRLLSTPPLASSPKEDDVVAPLGLWGAPRPPGVAERMREHAPKRRWTVNEHNV